MQPVVILSIRSQPSATCQCVRRCDKPATWRRSASRSISSETATSAWCCVHGFTGTPYEMRYLGEQLARAGFTVRGIRAPGPRHLASRISIATTMAGLGRAPSSDAVDELRARAASGSRSSVSRSAGCSRSTSRAAAPTSPRSASLAAPLWLEGLGARVARWTAAAARCARVRALPKLGGSDVARPARQGREPRLPRDPDAARSASSLAFMRVVDAELTADHAAGARRPRRRRTTPRRSRARTRIAKRTRRRARAHPAAQLSPDRRSTSSATSSPPR